VSVTVWYTRDKFVQLNLIAQNKKKQKKAQKKARSIVQFLISWLHFVAKSFQLETKVRTLRPAHSMSKLSTRNGASFAHSPSGGSDTS
jgi:hypothetical protein